MIADGHAHVTPHGMGGEILGKKFRESGGWFIALVSLPPHHYGFENNLEGIRKSFHAHINECRKVRESGLEVACIAGLHPALIDNMLKSVGPSKTDKVLDIAYAAIEDLRKLRTEGLIDGFGEFGRPHYRTLPESVIVNDLLMHRVFEVVKDYGGVIHLHLEQGGAATVWSVDAMAKCVGIEKTRILFHHASIGVALEAQKVGYYSTIMGKEKVLSRAAEVGLEYFIPESDYIDDPKRPGVVMYPWEIAGEVKKLRNSSMIERLLNKVMIDNVVRLYGVAPP